MARFLQNKGKNMLINNQMQLVEINVLVNGNRCKQYHHEGKHYIEAKENSDYELEFKNNSYGRLLAITSVDGISTITGKPASDACQKGRFESLARK